jgi:hypothetical protein
MGPREISNPRREENQLRGHGCEYGKKIQRSEMYRERNERIE